MRRVLSHTLLAFLTLAACASLGDSDGSRARISPEKAMEHVRAQVELGPRPPGSQQLEACRRYLEKELRSYGYEVERDTFVAQTPYGPVEMHNLIARRRESERDVIVLGSHYDTKYMEGKNFVGANDGASSTGLLVELARVLADESAALDYWFVFLDGEEAFVEWSTFDSTYGSRHLARRWKQEGVVARVRAFILLDMIGDRDLDIMRETNSTAWLMDLVFATAREIGLQGILSRYAGAIEDDHLPFLEAGIPSVDIIDLNFGPGNSFHHTENDTLDKVSPESLEKVGRLVLALLEKLQTRFAP